ncbi:MAG: extracellular solute-binding protein [Clostridiaceae bacterium]|nr:extracellular solute-binding protein [Clostridiaceae bacterium]
MKKVKELIVLFMVITAMIISGCGYSAQKNATQQDQQGAEESSKPIKVTLAMWELTDPDGNAASEKIYNKIVNDFGIEFEFVPVTWADSNDVIRMLASADDLPDVFVHLGWESKYEFKSFVDQQLIRDIPKELYSKYSHVNRVMEKYSYETIDGKMYHLPRDDRAFEEYNGNPIGFYYRKDIAAKAGYSDSDIEKAMTIDEFTDFLRAITKTGVYGISNAATVGIGYIREIIYPMFGYRPWIYQDGQWVCGDITDASKEATRWLHQIYKEGILDPEFSILQDTQLLEKFCIGTIGVAPYNLNTTNAQYFRTNFWEKINPDLDIDEYVGAIPLPTMKDGSRNSRPKTYWSCTLISSKVDDSKLDRVLDFYDWMYSTDGYVFTLYGEENVDYKIEGNNIVTLCKDENGNPVRFASTSTFVLMPSIASWHLDGIPGIRDTTVTDWDLKMDSILKETYWKYNFPVDFTRYLFTPAISEFDIEENVMNQYVKIIMQSNDFEADWDNFVQYLYKNHNLEEVTKEVNEEAIKKGIKWEPYK